MSLRPVLVAFVCSLPIPSLDAKPLPGQIIIDPEHPQYLKRAGGRHVFICGPGDPEDFLYRGKRNSDGTRNGDQVQLIQKLIKHGGNCIYLQVVRSHGGDGRRDHNPFFDSDPKKGIDDDILKQWEEWFTLMDRNNILIYLFLYDDGVKVWRTRGVEAAERKFIETIVSKFKHHKNLIWIVAEESEEALSTTKVHAIAKVIARADDHGHIIGNHHHSGASFKTWKPGGPLTHYSMQYTRAGDAAHAGAVEAFKKAKGKYQVIYAESTAAKPDALHAWRCAMGGLMPMMLDMDIANTPVATLEQCRHLQHFFESSDFYKMGPHDELAVADAKWVLAQPGQSYIAYAENARKGLSIKKLPKGSYIQWWLDCKTGARIRTTAMVAGPQHVFDRPKQIGSRCAVWITRENKKSGALSIPQTVFPGKTWQVRRPEDVLLDSKKLSAFAQSVGGDGVVIRNGYLVKTWGRPDRRADWASAGKPVMSTLLWFAVQEGKLRSVDDLVRPRVRKRWPGKDLLPKDRTMTFRHLADMTSGYARGEAPGTHYAYNDYGIKLYGTLLAEVFGASLNKASLDRLKALEFEDGTVFGSRGGLGVSASPRDFARIGWFWLNRGNWKGKQVLPRKFFDRYCKADVAPQLPRSKKPGKDYLRIGSHGGPSDQSEMGPGIYGFNWWFNGKVGTSNRTFMPHLPPDAFQANGHWGKECMLIVPSLRMVVAARGNWGGTALSKAKLLMEAVGK